MNPLALLQLEWKKFWPNGTFRTLVLCYAVFFGLLVWLAFLIGNKISFNANGTAFNPAQDLFMFPRSWELVAYIGSWLNVMVLGFIGVFITTVEWGNRTLRQNIIAGLTRTEFFTAKIGVAVALTLFATGIYLFVGFFAGMTGATGDIQSAALPPVGGVLRFFMQGLGYLLLGMVSGLLVRQNALATILYFGYVLFLESVTSWLLYLTVFKNKLVLLLPDRILENLAPFPFPRMAQDLVGTQKLLETLTPSQNSLVALAYLLLFAAILFIHLRKADL